VRRKIAALLLVGSLSAFADLKSISYAGDLTNSHSTSPTSSEDGLCGASLWCANDLNSVNLLGQALAAADSSPADGTILWFGDKTYVVPIPFDSHTLYLIPTPFVPNSSSPVPESGWFGDVLGLGLSGLFLTYRHKPTVERLKARFFLSSQTGSQVSFSEFTTTSDRRSVERPVTLELEPSEAEFFGEDLFLRMLRLERKRTERSGRPFALMLFDCERLSGRSAYLYPALAALSRATRETDIRGWYSGHIFGVILIEVQLSAIETVILPRVLGALASRLDIQDLAEIKQSVRTFPEDSDANGGGGGTRIDPFMYPELSLETDRKRVFRILKRALDVSGSLVALLIGTPLLLAIAVAIKLTSQGPVLFRQQRVGQSGKQFTFLKFRSMGTNCDETSHKAFMTSFIGGQADDDGNPKPVYKMTADSRITPIGKFLRRSSLDELPQFINVLKGEMSLVGPRPAIPYEVECYPLWQKLRLTVKPGMTGLWQVGGRSRTKFSEMVRLDLQYARTWSPLLDVKILLKTPLAVISGAGAH
jgi:lipopolysaccharide/colanic/teichoic acid biosynthesis glycosyltransferase